MISKDLKKEEKEMADKRLTNKNPNGTYRIPGNRVESMRMEWQQDTPVFFGTAVDKLGKYEDLGTPQELALLKEQYARTKK